MYPTGEDFSDLMSVAFFNALQDSNMLMPTDETNPATYLFPKDRVTIMLGGDDAIVGSKATISLPLQTIYLTVGRSYGKEMGYCGDTYTDIQGYIPFSVWATSAASHDDVEQRLEFSRQHRGNVYSSYGLGIITRTLVRAKPRPNSPITGIAVVDYSWEFFYART